MQLLSFEELGRLGIPFSTQHLNRLIRADQFPKPIKLGPARNSKKAWLKSDVDAWIILRIEMRDGGAE